MATGVKRKKPPTRKQLAARRKFVVMVKRRAREAKAAKRAAGGTKRRRNVAGYWDASIGKFRPIRHGDSSYGNTKTAYSHLAAGESPRSITGRKKAGVKRSKKYTTAAGKAKVAAYKKRTGRAQRNPVNVVKNGHRLYGAAAQAVLAKRAGTKRRRNYATDGYYTPDGKFIPIRSAPGYSRKRAGEPPLKKKARFATKEKKRNPRNGIFRTAARGAISRALTKPRSFKVSKPAWAQRTRTASKASTIAGWRRSRKKNSGAPAGIEQMHEKFLGRPSSHSFDIVAPSGTPKDVAVLGELTKLKTEDEEFMFEKGEAYMGADSKGNLYVLGDVQVEQNTNFGELEQICYLARKDHLEANPFRFRHRKAKRNPGTLTEYFHDFNEDGNGRAPKLKSDMDGMLHIQGGSFTVEPEGITG
jgi:hypothetical protein